MVTTEVKDWSLKIAGATPLQLVIISYEYALETIEEAKELLNEKNYIPYQKNINKAMKIIRELTVSLDMSYEISKDLMSLYIHVNKLLVDSYVKRKEEPLNETEKLLNLLLSGWRTIVEEENTEAVVKNAQQVYAGLTYGKGTLNETVICDMDRGLKA